MMFENFIMWLSFWVVKIKICTIWSKPVCLLKSWYQINYIERRLMRKGYTKEDALGVILRYVEFKNMQLSKSSSKFYKDVYKVIAEASDRTGLPQWVIRSQIEKEFHINI